MRGSQARLIVSLCLALLGPIAACARQEEGLVPAGAAGASEATLARYVRRLHLDLTGGAPDPTALAAGVAALRAAGNTAAARGELAGALLSTPAFARGFVAELESRAFAGQGRDGTYQLVCASFRANDAACGRCAPSPRDLCEGCDCPALTRLRAERAQLLRAADDLAGGAGTQEIERRFAGAEAFRLLFGAPEAVARGLFQQYLARAPDPDELRSAAAMVTGPLVSARAPSGLIFHRHGTGYADLVDILFSTEPYRDAVVVRAFARYLGRPALPRERAHFSATLDEQRPDARPLVRALLSSQEYLSQ